MKFTLSFLFLFISFISLSQQLVSGKVYDQDSLTIPFVQIQIKSINYNTVSNADGEFFIHLNPGNYEVEFFMDGFERTIQKVAVQNDDITLSVLLKSNATDIETIVISADDKRNRAREIIKHVQEKRKQFADSLSEFQCTTYCFGSLEKVKSDSLVLDSTINLTKLNIIEWEAISSYKAPSKFKDEFIAYKDYRDEGRVIEESSDERMNKQLNGAEESLTPTTIIRTNPTLFIQNSRDAYFSIFDNIINAPRLTYSPIVSPIAYNAFIYYDYNLAGVYTDSSGTEIYQIKVIPRFEIEPLFKGILNVKKDSWEILSYNLSINQPSLIFAKNLSMICEYTNLNGHLVPLRKEFIYQVIDEKQKINGKINLTYSNYLFRVEDEKKNYWQEVAVYQPDALTKNDAYWADKRPFKLKGFEERFMHEQDSILNYRETYEYKHKHDSSVNCQYKRFLFFAGYGHVNSFKKTHFSISGIINTFNVVDVGGFRIHPIFNYSKEFKSGKIVKINPLLDYGTLNKDLKGKVETSYLFNPKNFSEVSLIVGNTYDYLPGTLNYMSFIYPRNKYNSKKIGIGYRRELLNGLYAKVDIAYENRSSINGLLYPKLANDTTWPMQYTPIQFDTYNTFISNVTIEYYFKQQYVLRNNRKYVLGSPWPKLTINYKKAIPNIFHSKANFDFLELKISQEYKAKKIGYGDWRLMYGTFFNTKQLFLADERFFRRSNYIYFQDPSSNMQMIRSQLSSRSPYFQLNYNHNFNGFFLNKIWLINRLKLTEVVGTAVLIIPGQHYQQNEYFLGIEKELRIGKERIKIGVFDCYRISNVDIPSNQIKIGIKYYNFFTERWSY